jgi:diguanylate cyclase (GGDEF)-like protein/PAS domain S-box-containing protein
VIILGQMADRKYAGAGVCGDSVKDWRGPVLSAGNLLHEAIVVLMLLLILQEVRFWLARRRAKNREELFRIITENADDMIALVDMTRKRHYNSPSYKRVLGYSPAELAETTSFEQIHIDDRLKVLDAAREARETGIGKRMQYRMRHKNGTWRTLESTASPIRNDKGQVEQLVIVNRDVTDQKVAEEKLEHNFFHDALTGLPNHRLFVECLQQSLSHAQRNAEYRYAVLFLDIDGFKVLNDVMGRGVTDQVLVALGQRLSECLTNKDTIFHPEEGLSIGETVLARSGGDDFSILLQDINDPSNAMRVSQRLQEVIATPLTVEGHEVRASASIGIALNNGGNGKPEDLLRDAEVAMRRAKSRGRGRCEIFDASMHSRAVRRLELEAELRNAISSDQLSVHYQSIVQLETRRIVGFEALLRWNRDGKVISPKEFVEVAEDTGLIVPIGLRLLQDASQQLRDWQSRFPAGDPLQMTVKVSARQFTHDGFVDEVAAVIRKNGLNPNTLQLEMTEGVAMLDLKLTADVLSRLKRLGVRVVVEHFGTGRMPIDCLRRFPLDGLKLDRSLVGTMLTDPASNDILRLIMHVARELKLVVIAEGIEDPAQSKHLADLGCEFGQGFYFSKAVEAKTAQQLLNQRT